jgi:ParB family chromosome partitioning protein
MDLSQAVGFGVVVGRRRFLARREAGVENFVVGADCLIEEMSDEEAREASLVENLEVLRKEMDPITRAKRLNEIVSRDPGGLRGTARRLGLSPSTLSEWLKVLELSPKMQKAVSEGLLFYTDALQVARMKFGTELQDELAEVLETEGVEAFQKEVARRAERKLKRGIPKGKYIILRVTIDKVYKPDLELYERLQELAESRHMKVDEYVKQILIDHVKSVAG